MKWRFGEKRVQENGPIAEKDSLRKSERTRHKNKSGDIEKWDQTDSPEIPDIQIQITVLSRRKFICGA